MLALQTVSQSLSSTHGRLQEQKRENKTFLPDPFKRLDTLEGVYGMVYTAITNSLPMKIPLPLYLVIWKLVVLRGSATP